MVCGSCFQSGAESSSTAPPRLIITTDIGQDPDDMQSLIRLLHYANEFRIEGIIANADNNHVGEPARIRDDLIHTLISEYSKIHNNLNLAMPGFPSPEYLHGIVRKGCSSNGVDVPVNNFVGLGKDTGGSNWIIDVVDSPDPDPVCIAVWGGACDLAQALWKIRSTRGDVEVKEFIQKLRVYFIGKQDSSNDWIIDNFPELWLILALDWGGDKWMSSYRGMFWGGDMSNTSLEWLQENVLNQNPLAAMYPTSTYTGGSDKNPHGAMKEGDSPSFLYFLQRGFNSIEHPGWGSWGGRFSRVSNSFFRDAADTVFDESVSTFVESPRATVFRWRSDFQNDFAMRCAWGGGAPGPVFRGTRIVVSDQVHDGVFGLSASPGESVHVEILTHPEELADKVEHSCFFYPQPEKGDHLPVIRKTSFNRFSLDLPSEFNRYPVHVVFRSVYGGYADYHRLVLKQ